MSSVIHQGQTSTTAAVYREEEAAAHEQYLFKKKAHGWYSFVLNGVQFSFRMQDLFQRFRKNLEVEKIVLTGSQMTDVVLGFDWRHNDTDFLVRIKTPSNRYLVRELYVKSLCETIGLEMRDADDDNVLYLLNGHEFITLPKGADLFGKDVVKGMDVYDNIIIATIPMAEETLDISIGWDLDCSCFSSADSFQGDVETGEIGSADGYDFAESLKLLKAGYFYVRSGQPAKMKNGLRGYIHKITSGLCPIDYSIEQEFLEKWLKDYKNPEEFFDGLTRYFKRHYADPTPFLINLHNFFATKEFEGKEAVISYLDAWIPPAKRSDLFWHNVAPLHQCRFDSHAGSFPSRYKVQIPGGFILIEAPWSEVIGSKDSRILSKLTSLPKSDDPRVRFLREFHKRSKTFIEEFAKATPLYPSAEQALMRPIPLSPNANGMAPIGAFTPKKIDQLDLARFDLAVKQDPMMNAAVNQARHIQARKVILDNPHKHKVDWDLVNDMDAWQELAIKAPDLLFNHISSLPPSPGLLDTIRALPVPSIAIDWPPDWAELYVVELPHFGRNIRKASAERQLNSLFSAKQFKLFFMVWLRALHLDLCEKEGGKLLDIPLDWVRENPNDVWKVLQILTGRMGRDCPSAETVIAVLQGPENSTLHIDGRELLVDVVTFIRFLHPGFPIGYSFLDLIVILQDKESNRSELLAAYPALLSMGNAPFEACLPALVEDLKDFGKPMRDCVHWLIASHRMNMLRTIPLSPEQIDKEDVVTLVQDHGFDAKWMVDIAIESKPLVNQALACLKKQTAPCGNLEPYKKLAIITTNVALAKEIKRLSGKRVDLPGIDFKRAKELYTPEELWSLPFTFAEKMEIASHCPEAFVETWLKTLHSEGRYDELLSDWLLAFEAGFGDIEGSRELLQIPAPVNDQNLWTILQLVTGRPVKRCPLEGLPRQVLDAKVDLDAVLNDTTLTNLQRKDLVLELTAFIRFLHPEFKIRYSFASLIAILQAKSLVSMRKELLADYPKLMSEAPLDECLPAVAEELTDLREFVHWLITTKRIAFLRTLPLTPEQVEPEDVLTLVRDHGFEAKWMVDIAIEKEPLVNQAVACLKMEPAPCGNLDAYKKLALATKSVALAKEIKRLSGERVELPGIDLTGAKELYTPEELWSLPLTFAEKMEVATLCPPQLRPVIIDCVEKRLKSLYKEKKFSQFLSDWLLAFEARFGNIEGKREVLKSFPNAHIEENANNLWRLIPLVCGCPLTSHLEVPLLKKLLKAPEQLQVQELDSELITIVQSLHPHFQNMAILIDLMQNENFLAILPKIAPFPSLKTAVDRSFDERLIALYEDIKESNGQVRDFVKKLLLLGKVGLLKDLQPGQIDPKDVVAVVKAHPSPPLWMVNEAINTEDLFQAAYDCLKRQKTVTDLVPYRQLALRAQDLKMALNLATEVERLSKAPVDVLSKKHKVDLAIYEAALNEQAITPENLWAQAILSFDPKNISKQIKVAHLCLKFEPDLLSKIKDYFRPFLKNENSIEVMEADFFLRGEIWDEIESKLPNVKLVRAMVAILAKKEVDETTFYILNELSSLLSVSELSSLFRNFVQQLNLNPPEFWQTLMPMLGNTRVSKAQWREVYESSVEAFKTKGDPETNLNFLAEQFTEVEFISLWDYEGLFFLIKALVANNARFPLIHVYEVTFWIRLDVILAKLRVMNLEKYKEIVTILLDRFETFPQDSVLEAMNQQYQMLQSTRISTEEHLKQLNQLVSLPNSSEFSMQWLSLWDKFNLTEKTLEEMDQYIAVFDAAAVPERLNIDKITTSHLQLVAKICELVENAPKSEALVTIQNSQDLFLKLMRRYSMISRMGLYFTLDPAHFGPLRSSSLLSFDNIVTGISDLHVRSLVRLGNEKLIREFIEKLIEEKVISNFPQELFLAVFDELLPIYPLEDLYRLLTSHSSFSNIEHSQILLYKMIELLSQKSKKNIPILFDLFHKTVACPDFKIRLDLILIQINYLLLMIDLAETEHLDKALACIEATSYSMIAYYPSFKAKVPVESLKLPSEQQAYLLMLRVYNEKIAEKIFSRAESSSLHAKKASKVKAKLKEMKKDVSRKLLQKAT